MGKRYEKVHEKINVLVIYKSGGQTNMQTIHSGMTEVVGFRWQDTLYRIKKNNLITSAQKGSIPIYLFSVSNDAGAYQLRFETDTLSWFLEEIIWED